MNNQRGFFPIILGVLVLLVVVGAGAYYLGTQDNNLLPTATPQNNTKTDPMEKPLTTASWNTYSSQNYGFSIEYPKTIAKYQGQWEYKEFPDTDGSVWVGFRPGAMEEDYLWGVSVYDDISSVDEVIAEQGQQRYDRKEIRENIALNGNPALLVTVTTNQNPDLISKTVIVEKNGKVYAISNGAVELPEFDNFYNSFKILN